MKQVKCLGECGEWFDALEHWCPGCDWERPKWNGYLHRAKLDNALYAQAEHAEHERKVERAVRQGYEPPIDKRILKTARQDVKDM